jgi:hypothetical protein
VPLLQVEGLEYLLKNQIQVQDYGAQLPSEEVELNRFDDNTSKVEREKFWTENGWTLLNEFFGQPY